MRDLQARAAQLNAMLGGASPSGEAVDQEPPPGADLRRLFKELWFLVDRLAAEQQRWIRALSMEVDQAARLAEDKSRLSDAAVRRLNAYAAALEGELHAVRRAKGKLESTTNELLQETARLRARLQRTEESRRRDLERDAGIREERERRLGEEFESEMKLEQARWEEEKKGLEAAAAARRDRLLAQMTVFHQTLARREQDRLGREGEEREALEKHWSLRLKAVEEARARLLRHAAAREAQLSLAVEEAREEAARASAAYVVVRRDRDRLYSLRRSR